MPAGQSQVLHKLMTMPAAHDSGMFFPLKCNATELTAQPALT